MVSRMRLHAPARLLKGKIHGLAAGSPRSENTFAPDTSMKCTWPTRPYFLALANAFLRGWICPALGYQGYAQRRHSREITRVCSPRVTHQMRQTQEAN